MKNFTTIVSAFFVILLFNSNTGCEPVELLDIPESASGLVPIYDNDEAWKEFTFLPRQNVQPPNYRTNRGRFHFHSGPNLGVNIIDSDIGYNHSIGFIAIPKMHSMEVSNDTLYVGNYVDRLAFSITDPENITFISRDEMYYPDAEPMSIPYGFEGFIECPDLDRGVILSWERDFINNPTCWN